MFLFCEIPRDFIFSWGAAGTYTLIGERLTLNKTGKQSKDNSGKR